MKFEKDHLCFACEQGKVHRKHHKSKMAFASNKPLYLLHMDLCGLMRVQSINGKRYVLVVVDDYSRYTWVFFLHSKDEASEVIISFIKKTQVNLQLQLQRVRTDNDMEFKNKTLAKFFYEDVGKLKAKGDIRVFVGYSKESAAFRIYNKQTRKINEGMMAIFHDMIEQPMEVFMDDFSVFENSFSTCLTNLEIMLKRCEDTKLALTWEKSHFMVKEGIVLGHKISKKGIEVDKAKIEVISKLPHPTTVKGIRSFLGHAGFYRRFIKDFSKLSRPMTHLLEKNSPFIFSNDCIQAFRTIKENLIEAPILIAPNWDQPFELMCDASDYAVGAVLGQRVENHFRPIHYASKTMTQAETNYTTTKKEMLAVVYAFENLFVSYSKQKHCLHRLLSFEVLILQERRKSKVAMLGSLTSRILL
nr:reverse transcriptase domain-containing protein [Tanacetum cinerariifolium]